MSFGKLRKRDKIFLVFLGGYIYYFFGILAQGVPPFYLVGRQFLLSNPGGNPFTFDTFTSLPVYEQEFIRFEAVLFNFLLTNMLFAVVSSLFVIAFGAYTFLTLRFNRMESITEVKG